MPELTTEEFVRAKWPMMGVYYGRITECFWCEVRSKYRHLILGRGNSRDEAVVDAARRLERENAMAEIPEDLRDRYQTLIQMRQAGTVSVGDCTVINEACYIERIANLEASLKEKIDEIAQLRAQLAEMQKPISSKELNKFEHDFDTAPNEDIDTWDEYAINNLIAARALAAQKGESSNDV